MSKVRWGVLSTSRFAKTKVLPAMVNSDYVSLTAIASRDSKRAEGLAREFGIPKFYGTYEALLADPDIQAVYIPMPNHLHVEWSVKALEAGKHVLCEKPIGLDEMDATRLLEASRRFPALKVMEAFMYRLHPQWKRTQEIVRSGGVGTVHTIQSFFSFYNVDPTNIRNNPKFGGGALMDIGCYNISLSRLIFGSEPRRVFATMELDPKFGTDRLTSAILDFPSGVSTFTCSTQLSPFQRVVILGNKGQIEIEIPFNAPPDKPCRIWHRHDKGSDEITFDICDQYTIEADLFSLAVIDGTAVPTPLEDAVANMRVIDAVVTSAREDRWVSMAR